MPGSGVTYPKGYRAGGISCGIKSSRKLDLAMLVSDAPATAAACLTKNFLAAAPVRIVRKNIGLKTHRAVLITSGCANAATGPRGERDHKKLVQSAGLALGIEPRQILPASTGLIGTYLPVPRIESGLRKLKLSAGGGKLAARAMMTTDLKPKEEQARFKVRGRSYKVGGMAKGAGMIHPNMATLLVVLTTDAYVPKGLEQKLLNRLVQQTFNQVSVDQDTSTNDSVFLLANGVASPAKSHSGAVARGLESALHRVCQGLARKIAKEAEGAKKLIWVEVRGAATTLQAACAARAVVSSPLVKAAAASGDPNWGRIYSALGASGVKINPPKLSIELGGRLAYKGGPKLSPGRHAALKGPTLHIRINLGKGQAQAEAWGCDLTEEYVKINMAYS